MNKQTEVRQQKATVIPFHIDGEFFFKKGIRAYRRQDFDRAIQLLKKAHELEPEEPMILCQLAAVLSEVGQYQLSTEYLKIVIEELDPEMVECYYFISNNYAHLGLFHEAKKHAQKYIEHDPEGEFIEDTEDLLEVLTLEADIDGDEDDLIFLQDHARDLMDDGKYKEAIDVLNELLGDYPQFWSAYNQLALSHFYLGEIGEALRILDDVLEQNAGNLHAMCNKLVIFFYLREDQKVNDLFEQLKVVHPILMEHRYKLGATFGIIGKYELSLQWLLSLKKSGFEGDSTFYYWLTFAAYYTNHEQLAHLCWAKVVNMEPLKAGLAPWEKSSNDPLQVFDGKKLLGLFLELKKETGKVHKLEKMVYIKGFEVADLLFERFLHEEEQLYNVLSKWFHILPRLKTEDIRNINAIAAAIEFLYHETEGILPMPTKKSISNAYEISPSTASKYINVMQSYF